MFETLIRNPDLSADQRIALIVVFAAAAEVSAESLEHLTRQYGTKGREALDMALKSFNDFGFGVPQCRT